MQDERNWRIMFDGMLDRCLPLKVRSSGNLDLAPVMWISTDATLQRIGAINWYNKQFICLPAVGLFEPFMKKTSRPIHISDVELLAIALGLVVWVTDFRGTALNISDNINALQWIASQRAQHSVSLQLLRTALKWIIKKVSDFAGLYSSSHRNVSADHLTRLSYEEIEPWSTQQGFERINPFSYNRNWQEFLGMVQIGNEWEAETSGFQKKQTWRKEYGAILDWNPSALEVSQLRRGKGVPMWVTTPKHSMMDMWCKAMEINVWNLNETKIPVFIQVGLAKTEFEILDFQYICEQTRTKNAILLVPTGVGLPSDMRWEWTHKLVVDSCMFGDVVAAEWTVLLYMPGLEEGEGPDLSHVPKRVLEDAMRESGFFVGLESDVDIRTSPIERTRGMKVVVKEANGIWSLSRRSHFEVFSLGEIRNRTFPWPREFGSANAIPLNCWLRILGWMVEWGKDNRIVVAPLWK